LWFDRSAKIAQTPNAQTPAEPHRPAVAGQASTSAESWFSDWRPAAITGQVSFTLVDFRKTVAQLKKLGTLQWIVQWIPGMGKVAEMMGDGNIDRDVDLKQVAGIIDSMTPQERENPDLINISRRYRIAEGSGIDPSNIIKLLKEFSQVAGMMQQMAGMSKLQQMRQLKQMADGGLFDPGTRVQMQKQPRSYPRP
jgi:signal recognition particle subunit SRP54